MAGVIWPKPARPHKTAFDDRPRRSNNGWRAARHGAVASRHRRRAKKKTPAWAGVSRAIMRIASGVAY
ncbi:hypothetical protein LC55x_2888 [Lysobacter capsici]|nr:hypothetical protein LC55x_2888 [Lysobacter capsici]